MTDERRPLPERCIDCLPFQQMASQVASLDRRVSGMENRITEIAKAVREIGQSFALIEPSITRVIKLLEGNGKPESGFIHRVLNLEETERSRARWLQLVVGAAIGLLIAGLLGISGKLLIDAIQRGVVGGG